MGQKWKEHIQIFDTRRDIIIPGNHETTLKFCIEHFVHAANESIEDHGYFAVALSGGSTPKSIYQGLTEEPYRSKVDWKKVLLFWSDERSVLPTSSESNYHMAMEAGFKSLPLQAEQIFRMKAETEIEGNAKAYEDLIYTKIPSHRFDLIMLGMGEDGHTASLFPKTHGLHPSSRLVIANFIPQQNAWRMTLTYDCINNARHIAIYVMGKNKSSALERVLTSPYDPNHLPIQAIGTPEHRALWITDKDAAQNLVNKGLLTLNS